MRQILGFAVKLTEDLPPPPKKGCLSKTSSDNRADQLNNKLGVKPDQNEGPEVRRGLRYADHIWISDNSFR